MEKSVQSAALWTRLLPAGIRDARRFLHGNILVIAITNGLGNFARAMVFPYASLYILALGGNAATVGFIDALFPLTGLLIFPLGGYIADHMGRVKIIGWAGFLAGGAIALFVFAPSWQFIAVATLLRGCSICNSRPARPSLPIRSPRHRGGIATMNTVAGLLTIIAPYMAGLVVEAYGPNFGMRLLYAVMAVAYAGSGLIHMRWLTETSPNAGQRLNWRELPALLKRVYGSIPTTLRQLPRPLRPIAAVIVLSFMANAVVSPFWVIYAVEEIGLTETNWGLILLLEATLRNIAYLPAGALVDRWGRARSLAAALTLALIAIPLFVWAPSFGVVLIIRLVVAINQAITVPACTALLADLTPRRLRGQVMGAMGQGGIMLGSAGGGTGGPSVGFVTTVPLMAASIMGGYLYTANPTYPWLFLAGMVSVALILVVVFIRDPQAAEL
ncbi:MAG: MFS transporter [Caldilineaceae bacterium]